MTDAQAIASLVEMGREMSVKTPDEKALLGLEVAYADIPEHVRALAECLLNWQMEPHWPEGMEA
jgi:hypothetical protein